MRYGQPASQLEIQKVDTIDKWTMARFVREIGMCLNSTSKVFSKVENLSASLTQNFLYFLDKIFDRSTCVIMWSYCWVHIWHQSAQKSYHTRLKLKSSFTNTLRQQTRLRFKDVDESFGRRSKCADTRFSRGFKKSKHCEDVKWTLQARQRHSISETESPKRNFFHTDLKAQTFIKVRLSVA